MNCDDTGHPFGTATVGREEDAGFFFPPAAPDIDAAEDDVFLCLPMTSSTGWLDDDDDFDPTFTGVFLVLAFASLERACFVIWQTISLIYGNRMSMIINAVCSGGIDVVEMKG